jgi:spermidine/putrescine transport system ATP-binding protein
MPPNSSGVQDLMFDLQCHDVTKRFGTLTAVAGVSLDVPSGSFFSILGPSGCGKTTLMRMIAGFETPSSGDIRIKGNSVLATPPNKRNVKMVFQHLALFPMMNVGENIAYGLRCRGTPKGEIAAKVRGVLERIGLPGVEEKRVSQLSGGQRQRIAIARCMVLEPDVLLLDEPLGALDLKLRERMKIELKLLQHQFSTTFLYITHDQSEALVMSDNVAVMSAGRFEQIGSPQELYDRPATAFVAGFVGDSNHWRGKVLSADGRQCRVETEMGGELIGVSGASLSAGDGVDIYVRPEAVSVSKAANREAPLNHVSGTIDSLLFNGANSRILVRVPPGILVEVDSQNPEGEEPPRPGSPVELVFRQARTLCFPVRS